MVSSLYIACYIVKVQMYSTVFLAISVFNYRGFLVTLSFRIANTFGLCLKSILQITDFSRNLGFASVIFLFPMTYFFSNVEGVSQMCF